MIPVTYINENKRTREIKVSTYLLMLIISIIMFLALISKVHAVSLPPQNIPYQNLPYNAPQSRVNYCMQGYIGYEYSSSKERKCERLWGIWTRERILEESDYFNNL